MRLRIKHTPFIGVVVGSSGTAQSPTVELLMRDGSKVYYTISELTDKPPFDPVWIALDRIKSRLTP